MRELSDIESDPDIQPYLSTPRGLTGVEREDAWRQVLELQQKHLTFELSSISRLVESPVEELYLLSLALEFSERDVIRVVHPNDPSHRTYRLSTGSDNGAIWTVYPQAGVGKLRVDFVVDLDLAGITARAIIEIDGHDFHEKTKKQAAKDKARERILVATGVPVLRFSGSEVFRGGRACAQETYSVLSGSINRAIDDRNSKR